MNEKIILPDSLSGPFKLFQEWFEEASVSEINDPNAMNLSTISSDLKPSSRMVLLKNFSSEGFTFYTNINSKKGKSIIANPNVALNFHWKSLLRQVRIEGIAEIISDKEADDYFNSRPVESKIGAWASSQSAELKNRKILDENILKYKKIFKDKKIERPLNWTGFNVSPSLIEFWQDMPFRLHDRLEFQKVNNNWVSKKLFP